MSNASKSIMSKRTQGAVVSDLLAGKWTLIIVQVLDADVKRHSELCRSLPNVTQKVLTETLRKLERSGVVDRRVYPTVPPQVEYKLTPIGLDLLKLSDVLSDWVDIHEEEINRAQKSYDRRKKL